MPAQSVRRPPRPGRWAEETDTILRLLMQPQNGVELLEELLERPAWHARAACRGMGTEIFFPTDQVTLVRANRVCEGCPVRAECAEFALAHPSLKGIWAGMSERGRARTRKDALDAHGLEDGHDGRDARGADDPARRRAGGVGGR